MNEDQVGLFMAAMERWIVNRFHQMRNETVGEGHEEHEVNEAKENVAAALLGCTVNALPDSLQFTAP